MDVNIEHVITAVRRFFTPLICMLVLGLLASCTLQQPGDQSLQLIKGSTPVYPADLRVKGVGGKVTVQYDVTPQGQVVNAQVVASEPPGLFDAAALEAVRSWRFRPQVRVGQIESVVELTSSLEFRAP